MPCFSLNLARSKITRYRSPVPFNSLLAKLASAEWHPALEPAPPALSRACCEHKTSESFAHRPAATGLVQSLDPFHYLRGMRLTNASSCESQNVPSDHPTTPRVTGTLPRLCTPPPATRRTNRRSFIRWN